MIIRTCIWKYTALKFFKIHYFESCSILSFISTVEPLLRGHPDERPTPLERQLDNVKLNINVLISTPNERPHLLKETFLPQKRWPHKRGSTVL